MIDLFKQFFSFEKMMKDRLVASFFFLGLVVVVMTFFGSLLNAVHVMNHSFFAGLGQFLWAFFRILFFFVGLRLACELMVAIFHINDNLAPDGGKSDTADLDVFETARDAASKAASSATSATKSVVEKATTKLNERKDNDDIDYEDITPPKPVQKKAAPKKTVVKKTTPKKSATKKTTAKKTVSKKPATKKASAKKPTPKK
ncbi:MAG: hypothetical protein COA43_08645 [Robiginitomaculum sp.]|nr:MAG: hypothetical protein COA43_08645 [Robiginitomaculum sp.]